MLRIAYLFSVITFSLFWSRFTGAALAFAPSAPHSCDRTFCSSSSYAPRSKRSYLLRRSVSSSSSNGSNGSDELPLSNDAQYFKDQAERLREEIAALERAKQTALELEAQQQRADNRAAAELRDRYSVVVPILKPDGATVWESCRFTPIHPLGTSTIVTVESPLPLGILIGEAVTEVEEPSKNRSYIVIDEVSPDSFGAQSGLQVGDILHACTACQVEMELPTWQLLLGGIGRPKTVRYMHSVSTSMAGRRLETTMEAIASNRMDPEQRPILLVMERLDDP
jgi:hypothetical protein